MLLKLTLRDLAGIDRDVAVNAPPEVRLAAVVAQLSELCPDAAGGLWHGSRRLALDTPLEGEEWMAGIVPIIRNLKQLAESLDQVRRNGAPSVAASRLQRLPVAVASALPA